MSDEVKKYDGNRIDDILYAYSSLFLKRNFINIHWPNNCYDSNSKRVTSFPIDLVYEYMERLLQEHGKGALLHTIMAVNLECVALSSKSGRFSINRKAFDNPCTTRNNLAGLLSACGINIRKAPKSVFECMRCRKSIKQPESLLSVHECLRLHVNVCEMFIDRRYFEPLTDFYRSRDQNEYLNILNKTVAETVLIKMGILIIRSKKPCNFLSYSLHKNQRRISLDVVLSWRKRPRLRDDDLNRIVDAGYHALKNPKPKNWRDIIESLKDFSRCPMIVNKVTCFSCHHVVTVNGNFVRDPWRYHVKKSPNCKFLMIKKGLDYIRQVQESMYDLRLRNQNKLHAAVVDPTTNLQPRTSTIGATIYDLCEVITDRKPTEGLATVATTTVTECAICCNELRAVALMSCLHLATCVDCSFAIYGCPLCRKIVTGYIKPVFQPDGSFWKHLGCVGGGSYFINLPCRHLIESCAPDNVHKCPKAMEEDMTHCIVCGNSNMGKLKIYL